MDIEHALSLCTGLVSFLLGMVNSLQKHPRETLVKWAGSLPGFVFKFLYVSGLDGRLWKAAPYSPVPARARVYVVVFSVLYLFWVLSIFECFWVSIGLLSFILVLAKAWAFHGSNNLFASSLPFLSFYLLLQYDVTTRGIPGVVSCVTGL